jgi:hypothetical protein
MRVWPGKAGVCPVALDARVSSGVQLAGRGAGAGGAGVAAVAAEPPTVLLELLVPGLAQPAARVHAASVARPRRVPGRENGEIITAVVEVSVLETV